jgi:hypothetical protein
MLTLVLGAGANAQDVAYTGGSNPEHAKPGEVWCLMTTPPTFKTVSEQYECKPASCRFEVTPAVYEMQSEQVLCRKESTRCYPVAAVYKTESYQVEKCASRTEWQKVDCDSVKVSGDVKEEKDRCVALVTIPASYETRSRQVCVTPASTRSEVIPAQYKTVEKRVRTCEESKRRIEIPAQFATRTKEVCTGNGSKFWRLSDCPAPIGVPNCNKCNEKKEKTPCNTGCADHAKRDEIVYDSNYNETATARISRR